MTPAEWRAARAMPEGELQREVRQLCDSLGLLVDHVENSLAARRWVSGWPDLQIFGTCRANFARPAVLYRELKREGEQPTPEQRRVGLIIQSAGGNWGVWKPSDLLSGRIARELGAIAQADTLPGLERAV